MTPADIFNGMSQPTKFDGIGLERWLVAICVFAIAGVVFGAYELVRLGIWLFNHVSIN